MHYLQSTLLILILSVSTVAHGGTGTTVTYKVDGKSYEGYYVSPTNQAPLVLLIHQGFRNQDALSISTAAAKALSISGKCVISGTTWI